MRVLIAVPTYESITPDTFKALWDMDKGEHECPFEFVRGYDCATARNRIATRAQEANADYVLMVDNDVTPPKDALLNLLSHNQDVVCGYYPRRSTAMDEDCYASVFHLTDGDGKHYFGYPTESAYFSSELRWLREDGKHLVRIHGSGMGCALVRTDVFREVRYPWFDWVNYANDERGMLSEDLYFCEQLKNEGIPIHVDTRVSCGHLIRHIQTCD